MTKDRWVQSALTNEVLVVELLLRLKHSSHKDNNNNNNNSLPIIKKEVSTLSLPPRWGHHKTRSKSTAVGSPTTHLSWNAAASSSDGFQDPHSSSRSLYKANESASISSYNKLDHNHRNKMRKMELSSEKAETESLRRGFVLLPDLNMTPNEDDMSVMVMS